MCILYRFLLWQIYKASGESYGQFSGARGGVAQLSSRLPLGLQNVGTWNAESFHEVY